MKKKLLAMVLALALMLSMFVGCGGTASSAAPADASGSQEASAPAEEAPEEEPIEVDDPEEDVPEESSAMEAPEEPEYALEEVQLPLFEETRTYTMWTMLPFFMATLISDMAEDINNLKLLQEYCNVKLEITSVGDMVVDEQFNLMVANGDYPDIISDGVSHYTKGYDAAITDEIIIDLYDLAEEYAPNYMYYLNTDPALRSELITDNPDISYKDACYIYASAVASGHLPSLMDVKAGYYYFSDEEWAIFDAFRTCDADGSYNMPTGVALNEEKNEEYASISSDVTTYAATEIMKFATGQQPLTEDAFASFRQTIVDLGAERMEELYQAAYERYLNKIAE